MRFGASWLRVRSSLHVNQVAHQAGAYPGFCSTKRLGVFLLLPRYGMLVHRRVTPSIKLAGTYLYTWVERGALRVKCHNTMSLARARAKTAWSRDERTNHEATLSSTFRKVNFENFKKILLDHSAKWPVQYLKSIWPVLEQSELVDFRYGRLVNPIVLYTVEPDFTIWQGDSKIISLYRDTAVDELHI